MGIAFVYQTKHMSYTLWSALPYFSISLSLNVLLTLMIVIRLILHTRNTRTALGITGVGGLCKAVVIILVESCALYAVNSLLVIGPLGAGNSTWTLFYAVIAQTQVRAFPEPRSWTGCLTQWRTKQVIAPLLIIQRVANRSALTRNTIASGRVSEFKVRTQGEFSGGGAPPGGDRMSSAGERGTNSGEIEVGVQTRDINFHQDEI